MCNLLLSNSVIYLLNGLDSIYLWDGEGKTWKVWVYIQIEIERVKSEKHHYGDEEQQL